jgi:hypothetical protein
MPGRVGSKNEQRKEARRRTVAKGIIAGKKTKDIAREAQTTPRTVQRIQNEPETRRLIADLLKPHWKRFDKSIIAALNAIDRALRAMKKDRVDHGMRLRATERLGQYLELAQTGTRAGQPEITWEQFVRLYHKRQQQLAAEREAAEAEETAAARSKPLPN